MKETLEETLDKFEKTALRVKAERDLLLNAIHRIGYGKFGPADANASYSEVFGLIEEFARETYLKVVRGS